MPVKSLITAPADQTAVPAGDVRIAGFAWAGEDEISRVEVSTDGGRTWAAARLGRDRARYAWRQFEHIWRAPDPGSYLLMSRATDGRGRPQPIQPEWNPSGYLWNAIDRIRVHVGIPAPAAAAARSQMPALADETGGSLVQTRCMTCHDLRLIEQQRLDLDGWRREIDKMIAWGAGVTPEEKEPLVAYLARHYR